MGLVGCWCVRDHVRLEGKYANKRASTHRGQSYKGLTNQMGKRKEGSFGCNLKNYRKFKSLKIDPLKYKCYLPTWNQPSCLLDHEG
jgi:hypothetical protein